MQRARELILQQTRLDPLADSKVWMEGTLDHRMQDRRGCLPEAFIEPGLQDIIQK